MVRLTEDMVVARAKTSDMEGVLKLNFWGSDLTDISIVRQFKRVEILSFSLNQISTMADFQFCISLCELCIRRNQIKDLREVCYLQDLPRLRKLLMTENPCCDSAADLYRPTVIRALPNLDMLDNVEVTAMDREHARLYGLILEHPADRKEKEKHMAPGTRYYEGPKESQGQGQGQGHRVTPVTRRYEDNSNGNSVSSGSMGRPSGSDVTFLGVGQNQKSAAALSMSYSDDSCEDMQSPRRSTPVPNPRSQQQHQPQPLLQQQQQQQQPQRSCASPIIEYYRHENKYGGERRPVQSQGQGQGQGHWQYKGQGLGQEGRLSYSEAAEELKGIQTPKMVADVNVNMIQGQGQQGHYRDRDRDRDGLGFGLCGHGLCHGPGHGPSRPLTRKNNNIVAAILPLITELDLDSLDLIELALKRKRNECLSLCSLS